MSGAGGQYLMTPERTGIWVYDSALQYRVHLFQDRYGKHYVKCKATSIEISLSPLLLICASSLFFHLLILPIISNIDLAYAYAAHAVDTIRVILKKRIHGTVCI